MNPLDIKLKFPQHLSLGNNIIGCLQLVTFTIISYIALDFCRDFFPLMRGYSHIPQSLDDYFSERRAVCLFLSFTYLIICLLSYVSYKRVGSWAYLAVVFTFGICGTYIIELLMLFIGAQEKVNFLESKFIWKSIEQFQNSPLIHYSFEAKISIQVLMIIMLFVALRNTHSENICK